MEGLLVLGPPDTYWASVLGKLIEPRALILSGESQVEF